MKNKILEQKKEIDLNVEVNTLISHLNGCVIMARGDKRVIKNNY